MSLIALILMIISFSLILFCSLNIESGEEKSEKIAILITSIVWGLTIITSLIACKIENEATAFYFILGVGILSVVIAVLSLFENARLEKEHIQLMKEVKKEADTERENRFFLNNGY